MTDTTTIVNRWLDLSALCALVNSTADTIGYRSRHHYRYVSGDAIEFDIDGDIPATIRKVGKGRLARYRIVSNTHSL